MNKWFPYRKLFFYHVAQQVHGGYKFARQGDHRLRFWTRKGAQRFANLLNNESEHLAHRTAAGVRQYPRAHD